MATADGSLPQNPSQPVDPSQPTRAFGPVEYADTRRQAGFQMAADEPEDINVNSAVVRSQMLTLDVLGKEFTSNHDARQKMADANMDIREKLQDRILKA